MPPRKLTPALAITLAIVMVVASLGVYFYYFASSSSPPQPPIIVTLTITAPGGENASSAVSPQNFTLIEGQRYTLIVNNSENVEHELVIPTFNVTTGIMQGLQNARSLSSLIGSESFHTTSPQVPCHIRSKRMA